jgi:hypothetical protein
VPELADALDSKTTCADELDGARDGERIARSTSGRSPSLFNQDLTYYSLMALHCGCQLGGTFALFVVPNHTVTE